jgi:hypothetical protein
VKSLLRVCVAIGLSLGVWGLLGASVAEAHGGGGGHSGGMSHSGGNGGMNRSFNRGYSNNQTWWLVYQQQLQQQQRQRMYQQQLYQQQLQNQTQKTAAPAVPLNVPR